MQSLLWALHDQWNLVWNLLGLLFLFHITFWTICIGSWTGLAHCQVFHFLPYTWICKSSWTLPSMAGVFVFMSMKLQVYGFWLNSCTVLTSWNFCPYIVLWVIFFILPHHLVVIHSDNFMVVAYTTQQDSTCSHSHYGWTLDLFLFFFVTAVFLS